MDVMNELTGILKNRVNISSVRLQVKHFQVIRIFIGFIPYSKDSFVVDGSYVFQIKFCGKSPALRVVTNRYN